MAQSPTFKLNHRGAREALRTLMADEINARAEQVANVVRQQLAAAGEDAEVTVTPYTRDRQAATVAIADPNGLALQASLGALTRAAASVGLEVKPQ